MEKKDFDRLEQYIYIETILENLDKCINRIQHLEEKEKKTQKNIKILRLGFFFCILIVVILLVLLGMSI